MDARARGDGDPAGRVTFVVTNRGKYVHGFRIRSGVEDEAGRSAGPRGGGKGRFERRTELLQPGETARLTVDLAPNAYRLECYVEDAHGDHEMLGMRAALSVRSDAPFLTPTVAPKNLIAIKAFAYSPATLDVRRGATIRWRNDDSTKHTVSARNGSFTSKELAQAGIYARTFTKAGTFVYVCPVHPKMTGKVIVR